jgi:hypothetical protein
VETSEQLCVNTDEQPRLPGPQDNDGFTNIEELANGAHPLLWNGNVPLLSIGGYSGAGPVDLLVTAGQSVILTGSADIGNSVRLYRKFSSYLFPSSLETAAGTLVQESAVSGNGAFSLTLNSPGSSGLYTFTVAVENAAGDLNTQTLQLFVDSGAPQISQITLGGESYYDGMVVTASSPLEAIVTDDVQVISLNLSVDGAADIDMFATGNGTISYNASTGYMYYSALNLSAGSHTLRITAVDTSNFTAQTALTVQVSDGTLRLTHGPLVYPNPITGTSGRIAYGLTQAAPIRLRIYNINAELVWDAEYASGASGGKVGYNEVYWDLRNGWGQSLGNGVYIGLLTSGNTFLGKVKIAVYR